MDISSQSWKRGVRYSKNDIVRIENLIDIPLKEVEDSLPKLPVVELEQISEDSTQTIDWGLQKLDIPQIWSTSTGENVVIGVIDTGMPVHEDIGDNAIEGKNFILSEDIDDINGHQTHCVGIICAKNNSKGIVGVAPESKCLCVKALDKHGIGDNLSIAQAIDYCVDQKVDIINLSLGSQDNQGPIFHDAIKRAYNANIPIVCAAGNSATSGVNYPAAFDECIAVGASTKNNQIAFFSSTGEEVEIAAPGVDIYSTYLNNTYAKSSGTSMAAAFASGIVALLISKLKNDGESYTVDTIRDLLKTHADDAGPAGKDILFGHGIIDADGMVLGALNIQDTKIENNQEQPYGESFTVNPNWNYSAKAMIKKSSESAELIDNYKTFLTELNGSVDVNNSIGVGVGIQFYDKDLNAITPSDRRNTYRLLAQSELSHDEYYTAYLDIKSKDIPKDTRSGRVFIFVYGLKSGGFEFTRIRATTTSPFFYCTQDHESSLENHPGSELLYEKGYWTQDFEWRPSYGSKTNFLATNESIDLGEGSDYVNNLAINSLPLEIDVNFNNRTDKEAKAIMHFLQEKHFAYESIFGIDYRGDRLLSGDVSSFRFIYTHPYRKDLYFTCTDFSHSILYRNNNVVTAKFICNTESGLRSVESHAGYNYRLDVLVPVFIDKKTKFTKGEQIKLNTFSMESSDEDDSAEILEGVSDIVKVSGENAQIIFNQDQSIELGDCIFIEIPEEEGSVFSVGLTKIIHKIDDKNYIFGPILESGSDASPQEITIKHLTRCPEDCLASKILFPPGLNFLPPEVIDPVTGERKKRVVMLKNYRKIQIDSELRGDSKYIIVTPLSDFTLNAEDDFHVLISAARGRHSIYLENPGKIPKFPWLEVRQFEQRPSLSFELSNSPDTVQSEFVKYYNKKYKKQINQNLSKFTVVFDQRDDEEALEILQFLESHLGYKKFRFNMPRPYASDASHETTLSKPRMSIFFCPSWDHEIVYKNNHKISATFIESATSIEEDLFSVFGIGQEEDKPCYSAYLEDPITPHKLCTFSSVLQAAICGGFKTLKDGNPGIDLQIKAVDIIFIVDTTGSMVNHYMEGSGPDGAFKLSKFNAAIDVIKKMIVAHDEYIMPGTESYGGQLDAPEINFVDISGDNNTPPWAVDKNGDSLIDAAVDDINNDLLSKGFNTENLERFKIKIDQKRVNIGLMLMGFGPHDRNRTILNISDKTGFDKVDALKKIERISLDFSMDHYDGEDFAKYIAKAMAQMYNSPRAEYVTDRVIIMLSDGSIANDLKKGRHQLDVEGAKTTDAYSPKALEMCKAMRGNGDLAKRRPSDAILSKYGHDIPQVGTILKFLNEFKNIESDTGKSLYHNPDNGIDNPSWYEQKLNTIYVSVGIGVPGLLSNKLPLYSYDYDPEKHQEKSPEFYFEISSDSDQAGEVKRLLDLLKIVEVVSEASGYENYFSVTVHNCGPRDVEIKNTLANIESEIEPLKWTTQRLKSGIPKGGSFENLQYIQENETEGKSIIGTGGQYYGDPNNKRVLTGEENEGSNILWESFNTKYEVYRECGPPSLIDGGWKNKPSDGVNNVGIASKGMPIRVFTSSSGIDIIDYNIGNVTEENNFKGDYSHLPKLKAGESLDLFFGIRINRLANINENIQLVFNTDDGTFKQTDCYAEIKFPVELGDVIEPEPEALAPITSFEKTAEILRPEVGGNSYGSEVCDVQWTFNTYNKNYDTIIFDVPDLFNKGFELEITCKITRHGEFIHGRTGQRGPGFHPETGQLWPRHAYDEWIRLHGDASPGPGGFLFWPSDDCIQTLKFTKLYNDNLILGQSGEYNIGEFHRVEEEFRYDFRWKFYGTWQDDHTIYNITFDTKAENKLEITFIRVTHLCGNVSRGCQAEFTAKLNLI